MIKNIDLSTKENGLNPFPYLEYLFEKLPNIDKSDEKQLSKFLPWSKSITLTKTTRKYTQYDTVVFKIMLTHLLKVCIINI